MTDELIKKIMEKKEFSELPIKEVEIALKKFEGKDLNEWQRFKLVRQFLRKVYSGFSSRKVFNKRDMDPEWYLKKHKSTRERFSNYKEVYEKCLKDFSKLSVIDLGAGLNGFSYSFFEKVGKKVIYVSVEAIGQFVELMNYFFKKNKIPGKSYHFSLYDIKKVKELIKKQKKPKVVFLFKVIDSLEDVKRDYSKVFLEEIVPLVDRVVLSFATRSLGSRRKFNVNRNWIIKFIKERFKIEDDFEIGGERYIVFKVK